MPSMLLVKADNILLAPYITVTLAQEAMLQSRVNEPDSCEYTVHIMFVNRLVELDAIGFWPYLFQLFDLHFSNNLHHF